VLKIDERLAIPLDELRWEFARSGGPGGQNVNKVNSKVLLRWNPGTSPSLPGPVRARLLVLLASRLTGDGDLLITSQATRDQSRNLDDCLDKLRVLVLKAARPPKTRRPTRPTLGSKLRRVEDKSRRSDVKRGRRKPDPE
jgi:ribosome-associated protein